MVHTDVDPRDEILLRDVLAVEELVEVDHRQAGKVHIPHAARRRLRILAERDGEVVARPVGVVEKTLRSDNSLQARQHVQLNRESDDIR